MGKEVNVKVIDERTDEGEVRRIHVERFREQLAALCPDFPAPKVVVEADLSDPFDWASILKSPPPPPR